MFTKIYKSILILILMTKGIIYLIQPAELIGTSRYKIGCSNKPDLDRCKNGYKKGSRYICIMECNNPLVLERIIKTSFNYRFNLIAGCEFYEGDENEMYLLFSDLVNKHKQKYISNLNVEINYEVLIEDNLKNKNVEKNNINNIFPNYKQDNNFGGEKQLIHININDTNIIIKYIYMKNIKEQEIKRNSYINKLIDKNIIKNDNIYDLNNIFLINKINDYKQKIIIENFIFDEDIIYAEKNNLIETKIKNSFINNVIINNKIYSYTDDNDINNLLIYNYECIQNETKIIKHINVIYLNNSYYDMDYLKCFYPICIKFNNKDKKMLILNMFDLFSDINNSINSNKNKNKLTDIYLSDGPSEKSFLTKKNSKERYEYLKNTSTLINKLSIDKEVLYHNKHTELLIHMFS